MLDRLLGLETEYAIRYTSSGPRPSHRMIFHALAESLEQIVATGSGTHKAGKLQRFLQNGGGIYYEFLPKAPDGGLIEASTPECRGPSQLLLYQRAQERLLLQALPKATVLLRSEGFYGDLGLIKNCRDAEGHVYGAQENYEAELAGGPWLWIYRIGLLLLLPIVLITGGLSTALALVLLLAVFAVGIVTIIVMLPIMLLLPNNDARDDRLIQRFLDSFHIVERVASGIGIVGSLLGCAAYSLLFRLCCFRRIRRDALGFLVSRPLITGTGTLDPQTGTFGLSEKGPAIRSLVRTTVLPGDRSLFDPGNLIKHLYCIMDLRLWPLARLFRRRQRLQLGLSDSNCAQHAEYLKLATTSLVLDMAEAGALRELPRLRRPIRMLHRLCEDPSAKLRCSDGVARTGVELQRLYLDAARRFVAEAPATSLEAREIVELWAETLDILEHDPRRGFGRIDWVTKQTLIDEAGDGLELAARKKIDLKYAELDVGYLAKLEREGLAPRLIDDAELELAIHEPPADTPARRRSALIRELARGEGVTIDWDRVQIRRGFLRRDVIRLDDYRR